MCEHKTTNSRIDIIGQNGNGGEHYDWNYCHNCGYLYLNDCQCNNNPVQLDLFKDNNNNG